MPIPISCILYISLWIYSLCKCLAWVHPSINQRNVLQGCTWNQKDALLLLMFHAFPYTIFCYDVMLKSTLCCQGFTGTSSSCQLYSLDPSLGQMEDRFQHKHPLEFPVVVISVLLTVLFTILWTSSISNKVQINVTSCLGVTTKSTVWISLYYLH